MVHEGEPKRGVETPTVPLTDYADAVRADCRTGCRQGNGVPDRGGEAGHCVRVTVRNFRTFDKAEWRDTTLFLGGLDEVRAGTCLASAQVGQMRVIE